jgi:hypothetical protein
MMSLCHCRQEEDWRDLQKSNVEAEPNNPKPKDREAHGWKLTQVDGKSELRRDFPIDLEFRQICIDHHF